VEEATKYFSHFSIIKCT